MKAQHWLLGALLGACATESQVSDLDGTIEPLPSGDEPDVEEPTRVRLDVYPTDTLLGDALDDGFRAMPKTSPVYQVDGSGPLEAADIRLDAPIRFTGRIDGFQLNPQVSVLPGETVPVPATVSLILTDTAQSYVESTNEFGQFDMWVAPQTVYVLSVSPGDAAFPNFSDVLPIAESARDIEIPLPFGSPVYGHVESASGPIVGASVFVVGPDGEVSASARTDEDGWYTVRVLPGTYDVVCDGGNAQLRPVITQTDIEVDEEGAFLDFEFVDVASALVGGRVISKAAVPLDGTEVRFTARNLPNYTDVDASWSFTARLDEGDLFLAKLIPGSYDIDVVPPAADPGLVTDPEELAVRQGITPQQLIDVVVVNETTLPDIELLSTAFVIGTVVDVDELPVEAVRVDCTEIGFGSRQWSTLTDVFGLFELQLPQVAVTCRFVPTTDSGLASRVVEFIPGQTNDARFTLYEGTEILGRVRGPDGQAERFATVSVREAGGTRILGTAVTDEEGRYAVRVSP